MLINLEHRGAIGGDKSTGDGAGILFKTPDAFFRRACAAEGFRLPAPGEYAAGFFFLPTDTGLAARCRETVERVAREEGCPLIGWREVPVDRVV